MDQPEGSWAARGGLGPWNTSMRSAEPQVSEVLPVQGLLHWVCGTDVMVLSRRKGKSVSVGFHMFVSVSEEGVDLRCESGTAVTFRPKLGTSERESHRVACCSTRFGRIAS